MHMLLDWSKKTNDIYAHAIGFAEPTSANFHKRQALQLTLSANCLCRIRIY